MVDETQERKALEGRRKEEAEDPKLELLAALGLLTAPEHVDHYCIAEYCRFGLTKMRQGRRSRPKEPALVELLQALDWTDIIYSSLVVAQTLQTHWKVTSMRIGSRRQIASRRTRFGRTP